MLTLQTLGCMQCQVGTVIARLTHKPFRLCPRCASRRRQARAGWNAWRQTVAAVSHDDAVIPAEPARPRALTVVGAPGHDAVIPPEPARPHAHPTLAVERPSSAVAWPPVVQPGPTSRKADGLTRETVDWRD
jgi:hypothetical protein